MFFLWWCNTLSVFLFKQKTAYEMRISDWSSDVCSSDLTAEYAHDGERRVARRYPPDPGAAFRAIRQSPDACRAARGRARLQPRSRRAADAPSQIGRASCRERVCQYV